MKRSSINRAQIAATRAISIQSSEEQEAYEIDFDGLMFRVLPGVFSPRYFEGPHFFTRMLPYRSGEQFLEVGCGTGITSVVAALHGAHSVTAVDINTRAVENTLINAARHGVSNVVLAKESDVYDNLPAEESFDTIYWNLPFLYVEPDYEFASMLERSLFDPGYRLTTRFLAEGRRHLRPNGRLLVGFGDFGAVDLLYELAAEYGYQIQKLAQIEAQEGLPVQFVLYELRT